MERVFAPDGPDPGTIVLDKDEAHHLTRVRRVSEGSMVEAFDGQGHAWRCRLTEAGKHHATLVVESQIASEETFTATEFWLATAVPKGDRFDWIVEKATELGVNRLVPLICERSVVEPRSTKIERLRRTVIEACKQCGRNRLMTIDEPTPLAEFLAARTEADVGLWADQTGAAVSAHSDIGKSIDRVIVCVGPEGGWTDDESALAARLGWRPISLGPHILRIETAAIAAAAVLTGKMRQDRIGR